MKYVFSIVVINKNNISGLLKTLGSIYRLEELPNTETIIVDGYSTDGSLEYAEKLISDRFIFRVQRESRPGIFNALNDGIKAATGEWIIFMNAGDCFASEESLSGFCPPADTDVVLGKFINYEGLVCPLHQRQWPWAEMPTCHQAMMFRATVHKKRLYRSILTLSADFEWILWAQKKELNFVTWDKVIADGPTGGASYYRLANRVLQYYFLSVLYYPFDRDVHHYYINKLRWAYPEQVRRQQAGLRSDQIR